MSRLQFHGLAPLMSSSTWVVTDPLSPLRMPLTTSLTPRFTCLALEAVGQDGISI